MLTKDLVKMVILFLAIIGTTVGSSLALNLATGPKIEADKIAREEAAAQQAAGVLLEVLPGAKGFEEITSSLTIDPASGVTAVHKETSGLGYVFIAGAKGYSQVVEVTVGIDKDGKITGLKVNTNGDYSVEQTTIDSYTGQDSTLSGAVATTGATASSNAVKNAVASGMIVLAANDLMSAAAKTVEQIYEELLLTVYPGFVYVESNELTPSGDIVRAFKANNASGVVCYVAKGDTKLLAIYSIGSVVKVFEPECVDEKTQVYTLKDVTADNSDVVTKASEYASEHIVSQIKYLTDTITGLYSDATNVTEIQVTTFGDVVAAVSFVVGETTYYGFYTRPNNSFGPLPMEMVVVLDSEGKIAKVDVDQMFIQVGYFEIKNPGISTYPVDEYLDGFVGLGSSSITDAAFSQDGDFYITLATKTVTGVKDGLNAAYALFETLQGGNN